MDLCVHQKRTKTFFFKSNTCFHCISCVYSFTTPDPSPQSAAEDTPPNDRAPPTNPPQLLATPPAVRTRKASTALQTEEEQEEAQPQRRDTVLIKDIRDLQRDKWLLERELQVWRVAVQSEQGSLEDRCSEMEANMETLRQHNLRLQDMLSQVDTHTHTTSDCRTCSHR
uniref:Uncharacterized protein n=1 Tax=Hucho hucho TaxID=62062 RepID=A0A4W5QV61_9TELE